MPYDYPPSEAFLRFGQPQENTHFYGKGIAFYHSPRLRRVRCTFEVGYTQDCKIIVVCYVELPPFSTNFDEFMSCYRIVGRGLLNKQQIVIEGLSLKHSSHTFGRESGITLSFRAECFKISQTFSQEPANSDHPPEPHFDVVGIDLPEWLDPNNRYYDERYKGRLIFPVNHENENALGLLFQHSSEQRLYDNQVAGRLYFPIDCVLEGWDISSVADLWCGLISLALGRDIQWTSLILPDRHNHPDDYERVWYARNIRGTAKFDYLILQFLHKDSNELQEYIRTIFVHLAKHKIAKETLDAYIHIIRQYVEYRLVDTPHIEGEIRLITTLTEEFLHSWEQAHEPSIDFLVTKTEREKIGQVIEEALSKTADTFQDYLDENRSKRQEVIDKILKLVHDQVRYPTFFERLERFFKGHNHWNEPLAGRVRAFIATRNSAAHRGTLAWLDDEVNKEKLVNLSPTPGHEWYYEYQNALMMIPWMVFCVFGYEGNYNDLVHPGKKQSWKPD